MNTTQNSKVGSMGFNFGERLFVAKTERGWEAWRGSDLVGIATTRDEAKKMLGAM